MFRLAYNQTPPKVAGVPYIPMLEEHNVRSGFFTQEEYLAVRGALPDYAQVAIAIAYHTGMRIGEVLGLRWSQVDMLARRMSLAPTQTKTETQRVVYMTDDLYRVLSEARRRQQASFPDCLWVCALKGERVESIKKCWRTACKRVGLEGRLIHDFRRTAVRNMTKAGIPEKVAMAISGHRTRSVFDRYNIVHEGDLKEAAGKMSEYYQTETVTRIVTEKELEGQAPKPASFPTL
jgi:integrase